MAHAHAQRIEEDLAGGADVRPDGTLLALLVVLGIEGRGYREFDRRRRTMIYGRREGWGGKRWKEEEEEEQEEEEEEVKEKVKKVEEGKEGKARREIETRRVVSERERRFRRCEDSWELSLLVTRESGEVPDERASARGSPCEDDRGYR